MSAAGISPSWENSNLSNGSYGYDFVVATTQAGINDTMFNFLVSRQEPLITICFVCGEGGGDGQPIEISYDELKKRANGTDPFTVPDGAASDSLAVQNLLAARFMVGFKARLGVPRVRDPSQLPDIVTLAHGTTRVGFGALFSEFTVVALDPGTTYSPRRWYNAAQQPTSPWIFKTFVDLRLSTVEPDAYQTLPPAVQKAIMDLGSGAFSVQQLLFDLSNATLESIPTFSGIPRSSWVYLILQQYFIGLYFTELQKDGQPILGCSVVQQESSSSTLDLTSFNLEACQYVGSDGVPDTNPTEEEQQLATLNYLCATNGNYLPMSAPFTWNWVDSSQANDVHGAIAINRNTLANYFRQKLEPSVLPNCLNVKVALSYFGPFPNQQFTPGGAPTVTIPTTGPCVLRFAFSSTSSDRTGLAFPDMRSEALTYSYSMSVYFIDNTIVIKQYQTLRMHIIIVAVNADGNIMDSELTDTFTLDIGDTGQLKTSRSSSEMRAATILPLGPFTNVPSEIISTLEQVAPSSLPDVPLSFIQDYVFPGGQTFIFRAAAFSKNQDLVSFFQYADPSAATFVVPA